MSHPCHTAYHLSRAALMRSVVHNSVRFPLVDLWFVQRHQVCCTTSLRFVITLRRVSLCSLVLLSQCTFSHLQRCCFMCCYGVASGDASADPRSASDSSPSSDGCHPGFIPAKLFQICARASINHSWYAPSDNLDPDSGLSMPRGLEDSPCSSESMRSGLGAALRAATSVSSTLTWDASDSLSSPSPSLCSPLSPSSREYVTVDSGGTHSGASDTRGELLDRGVIGTLVSGADAPGAGDGSSSGAK